MANEPLRRTPPRPVPPPDERPKIWAEGKQRPPFTFRGLRRATLFLSRDGVAPLNAWAARTTRRVAVNVANGAGRIPEGKLGRVERFIPSHLRVAGWIKNTAAVLAHASAVADLDVKRGNALVSEIEPHLWPEADADEPASSPPEPLEPEASPFGADAPPSEPVVLAEPVPPEPEPDPLAAIRDDLEDTEKPARKARATRSRASSGPALPPDPPGPLATNAIQVAGYLTGWATVIVALPYGLVRSLWLWGTKNVDLRQVGKGD
jgi:hypothetical protein